MSYDLMVFDKTTAPKDRNAFGKWFEEQVERGETIYASFAWSLADEACEIVRRLAQKHDVGFCNVDNGDIFLPDGTRIE